MLVGVVLTIGLVVLSVARVSPSGISYRSPQIWSNQATLVLTQEGAPELRSVLPAPVAGGGPSLADTSRFAGLIDVYTTLATSDPVIRVLERRGLITEADMQNGTSPITAAAVVSMVGGAPTPMMSITATSLSGPGATKLTKAATSAFLTVVRSRQVAAKIPVKDRIQLRVVRSADEPQLVKPRSKALPMLVLLAGLIATGAVAFTRDNVARRHRATTLTTAASGAAVAEPDVSTPTAPTRARSSLGTIPRADAGVRQEPGASAAVVRGRSTLGSVPRADAATPRPLDGPDDDAQAQQLRQARTSGGPSG